MYWVVYSRKREIVCYTTEQFSFDNLKTLLDDEDLKTTTLPTLKEAKEWVKKENEDFVQKINPEPFPVERTLLLYELNGLKKNSKDKTSPVVERHWYMEFQYYPMKEFPLKYDELLNPLKNNLDEKKTVGLLTYYRLDPEWMEKKVDHGEPDEKAVYPFTFRQKNPSKWRMFEYGMNSLLRSDVLYEGLKKDTCYHFKIAISSANMFNMTKSQEKPFEKVISKKLKDLKDVNLKITLCFEPALNRTKIHQECEKKVQNNSNENQEKQKEE